MNDPIPRGKYRARPDPAAGEAEHFIRCEICGGWVDCRDLGIVAVHAGPLPHPSPDQPQ